MAEYGNIDRAFLGLVSESRNNRTNSYAGAETIGFGIPVYVDLEDNKLVSKKNEDIANVRITAVPDNTGVIDFVRIYSGDTYVDAETGATATLTLVNVYTAIRDLYYSNGSSIGGRVGATPATDIEIRIIGQNFSITGGSTEDITGIRFVPVDEDGVEQTALTYEVQAVASTQAFAGITRHVHKNVTLANVAGYEQNESVSVLEKGRIWAICDETADVKANSKAYINTAGQYFTSVSTSGTDVNCTFRSNKYNLNFTKIDGTVVNDYIALVEVNGISGIDATSIADFYNS